MAKVVSVGWLFYLSAMVQAYDEPTVKQLWQETQNCLERLTDEERQDASLLYRLAPAQVYAGDYDAGWRIANSIKSEFSRDVAQGGCWQARLEMDGQERELPAGISDLTRSGMITDLAMMYIQSGDAVAAAKSIERMPTEGADYVFRTYLYWRLGLAQLTRNDKAAALKSLALARKQVDQTTSGSSFRATMLYIVIGEACATAGDLAAARDSLARAVRLAEKDEKHEGPQVLTSLSWAWVARGQSACQMPEGSARSFSRAADIAIKIPKQRDGVENPFAHRDRAQALNTVSAFEFRTGRKEHAAEHFGKAIESLMTERDESARAGQIASLIDDQSRGGDPELARSALDRVRSVNYRVKSQCVIANCLFERGATDQAAALLRDAEAKLGEPVDEDSVGTWLEVAETWARIKQPEAARNSFQQAEATAAKLKLGDRAVLAIAASQWRAGYFDAAYERLKDLPGSKDKCLALAELTTAVGKARAPRRILQLFVPRTIADPF